MTGWKVASVALILGAWSQTMYYAVTARSEVAGVWLLVAIAATVVTAMGWDS